MRCLICNKEKLSREFIHCPISPNCDHPRLICLRCACAATKAGKCPYEDCDSTVSEDSVSVQEYRVSLAYLFEEIEEDTDDMTDSESETFNIVMLTGKRESLPYDGALTIIYLKQKINEALEISVKQQRLLYNENELTDHIGHKKAILRDFDIRPGSTVYLFLVLYTIPRNLDHVKFDLFWEFPPAAADFIDATCFLYQNTKTAGIVHQDAKTFKTAVCHSGDDFNVEARLCTHTVDVYLKRIPEDITHLFFTISAYQSPTISEFPNPSLRFYEASNPNVDLCTTTFSHEINSQALIMCCVVRKNDSWEILESGKESKGNNEDYKELQTTIESLISGNFEH